MLDQPNHLIERPDPLERALLILLLRNSPGQLTSYELMRELRESSDVVEHAIARSSEPGWRAVRANSCCPPAPRSASTSSACDPRRACAGGGSE